MSLSLYAIQSRDTRCMSCEPVLVAGCKARVDSLLALVRYSFRELDLSLVGRRMGKIINSASRQASVIDQTRRAAYLMGVTISLIALRLLSAVGGVICPELLFGYFRLHRELLLLGLHKKIELLDLGRHEQKLLLAKRVRSEIMNAALHHLDELEGGARRMSSTVLRKEMWEASFREIMAKIGVLEDEEYSVFSKFQKSLLRHIAEEAKAVQNEKMYSRDDVEDMMTAFQSILYRAVFRLIDQEYVVDKVSRPRWEDGSEIMGPTARKLDEWNNTIVEIKNLVGRIVARDLRRNSRTERELLMLYLYGDDDLCKKIVRPDLPDREKYPEIDRVFKLVGDFVHNYVYHNLPKGPEFACAFQGCVC